jgi:hypothetical protein
MEPETWLSFCCGQSLSRNNEQQVQLFFFPSFMQQSTMQTHDEQRLLQEIAFLAGLLNRHKALSNSDPLVRFQPPVSNSSHELTTNTKQLNHFHKGSKVLVKKNSDYPLSKSAQKLNKSKSMLMICLV